MNQYSYKERYAVEYLKSSLSVSSYVGCPMGCKYCVLSSLDFETKLQKITEENDLVKRLLSNRYFVSGFTPISINNRTDPFLNTSVKSSTFKILELLAENKVKNPLLLITKRSLTQTELKFLDGLNLNTHLFLSYSGLPKLVEPINDTLDKDFLANLKKAENIKPIHYWRPIIEGINDDEPTLEKVLRHVQPHFFCSIVSGIRLTKEVRNSLKKCTGIKFKLNPEHAVHKYLSSETTRRILELRNRVCQDYLLFRHTSCVLSFLSGIPDYNAHYVKPQNCIFGCPNYALCDRIGRPPNGKIEKLLKHIGKEGMRHTFEDKNLNFEGTLSQEERSFLRHNLMFKVSCDSLSHSPSERTMLE